MGRSTLTTERGGLKLPPLPTVVLLSPTMIYLKHPILGRSVRLSLPRHRVPISATKIRNNLVENFSYLVPDARAALCRRIVVAGPESSGKTTLTMALAQALGTAWVPEYGRLYCDGRGLDNSWDAAEFTHIANIQTHMIDSLARQSSRGVLIADTDALVTRVWQRRYLPESELIALPTPADHYLVCKPVPWEQDGTRESEEHREAMQVDTLKQISALNADHTQLSGTPKERLSHALQIVDTLTKDLQ